MYKICFYVPTSHAEEVKNSMFAKGAGKIGTYSCCAWQTLGEGQFMPLTNGEIDALEKISELKIEMVCEDTYIAAVIEALKTSHPYEEPTYHVWRVENM
jgi:hypothetical protein